MARISEAARAARREQILAAGLACFARHGYHATTMADVAGEAGVAKGTPYLYYPTKEALFLALYRDWDCGLLDRIQAAVQRLEPTVASSPREVLRVVVLAVGAHAEDHAEACRVLMEANMMAADQPELAAAVKAAQTRSDEQLGELIEAGIAAGEWPAGTDPTLEARLISSALYGLMARRHLSPQEFPWARVAGAIADRGRTRAST